MVEKKKLHPSSENPNFWMTVESQFAHNSFSTILSVRNALLAQPNLSKTLVSFLLEPISIDSNLELKNRFELLPSITQYNFIILICITPYLFPIFPKQLLINPFLANLYLTYNEIPPEIEIKINSTQSTSTQFEIPIIEAEVNSKEFFTGLDQLFSTFPDHAEEIANKYCQIKSFQNFYFLVLGFFETVRSLDGIKSICKYVIYHYIASLTSSAHRQVGQALGIVAISSPELLVDEVIVPLFFSIQSTTQQFELLKRLVQNETVKKLVLQRMFLGKVPSLEPQWSKDSLEFFTCLIRDAQEQLEDELQKIILLHIQNQMSYDLTSSQRFLLHFLKNQKINDEETRQIALSSIELLTGPTKDIALTFLKQD